MPSLTDIAVCIRTWDFSETSQTVSFFSREHGIIRGLAKGSRRDKAPFSGGIDVLTRGQVVAIVKPGRDLATITAWHLQELYPAVRRSLPANRAGLYMADLVHHMLIEHDPHPHLFDAFTSALAELEEPGRVDQSLLQFQWALLTEAGYQPRVGGDQSSASEIEADGNARQPADRPTRREAFVLFHPLAGGVVNHAANEARTSMNEFEAWRVRQTTIHVLRTLRDGGPMMTDARSIGRANRLLAAYFRQIIGREPPTMRWAFADRST